MSSYLVGLVLDRYQGKANLKLTLLSIADTANRETNEARVSYELLAKFSCTSRRQAIRNVDALVSEGVVILNERGGFMTDLSTGKQVFVSNVYEVNQELLSLMPSGKQDVRSKRATTKSIHGDTHDTVVAKSHSVTHDTLQSYPQGDAHGDTHDTVQMPPMTPCSSVTHDTRTKTLEPRTKDQGLDLTDAVVDNSRLASLSERRAARDSIRSHLADSVRESAIDQSREARQ